MIVRIVSLPTPNLSSNGVSVWPSTGVSVDVGAVVVGIVVVVVVVVVVSLCNTA